MDCKTNQGQWPIWVNKGERQGEGDAMGALSHSLKLGGARLSPYHSFCLADSPTAKRELKETVTSQVPGREKHTELPTSRPA